MSSSKVWAIKIWYAEFVFVFLFCFVYLLWISFFKNSQPIYHET